MNFSDLASTPVERSGEAMNAGDKAGMLAAMASSALGGTAVAVTRDVVGGTADPVLLGALRFLSGAALLLPRPLPVGLPKWAAVLAKAMARARSRARLDAVNPCRLAWT